MIHTNLPIFLASQNIKAKIIPSIPPAKLPATPKIFTKPAKLAKKIIKGIKQVKAQAKVFFIL